MTELVLIAAVARNGVIGDGSGLPWHLPEDLAFFRRATMGAPVLMGRRTWDSVPARFRPLPGRDNIVLTRDPQWQAEGARRAGSLADALALVSDAPHVFVIGGGELYREAMPRADTLLLTEIDRDFDGGTRFPPWHDTFDEVSREHRLAQAPNAFGFAFVRYRRRGG